MNPKYTHRFWEECPRLDRRPKERRGVIDRIARSTVVVSLLVGLALALSVGVLHAQGPEIVYVYDDLGRLAKVVNVETGDGATYEYDAVGNILSITRTTGGLPPPSITSVSQNAGLQGDTVCPLIGGESLLGVTVSTDNTEILISDVRTSETTLDLCLNISFLSAAGPSLVTVSNPIGSTTFSFAVGVAAPTITAIDPTSGPPTRLVTISGTAFSPTPAVNIVSLGGVAAPVFSSNVFSIKAAVPSGAPAGPTTVTVTVEGRTSNAFPFEVTAPTAAPPVIDTITPSKGSVDGGSTVLIRGSNFTADTRVFIGNREVDTFLLLDPTAIKVIPPSSREGPADVLVTNAAGDAFLPGGYTYVVGPAPRVVAVNPALGLSGIPTNVPVGVLFSTPIDPATVNTSSFSLVRCNSSEQVTGSFTFDFDNAASIFRPSANLAANTCFTLSLAQDIESDQGVPLDAPLLGSFTTAGSTDTLSPSVSVNPPNGATGVPQNTGIVISVSEPVNPVTANSSTLRISNDGQPVEGSIILGQGNRVMTYRPSEPFVADSIVEIVLSSGVTDVAGNSIVGSSGPGTDFLSNFFVGAGADLFPPRVIAVNPRDNAFGVNVSSSVSVTFSKAIDPASIDTANFRLSADGTDLAGAIFLSGGNTIATFNPTELLPAVTDITVNVDQTVRDLSGKGLIEPLTSVFTTAPELDNVRPLVVSITPFHAQLEVPMNAPVVVEFSEAIDPLTIDGATFRVTFFESGFPIQQVPGAISMSPDGRTVTFTPAALWVPNKRHDIRITTGVGDVAGNPLLQSFSSRFTTTIRDDTVAPAVAEASPPDGFTEMPGNGRWCVRFSEAVSGPSVNSQSVSVAAGGIPVEMELSLELLNRVVCARRAQLFNLELDTTFVGTVTPGVEDVAGNALAAVFTSAFTTSAIDNLSLGPGVTINVSSGSGPERAIDGNLDTSWFTAWGDAVNRGGTPFFEIILPGDATVTELRMFGHRAYAGFDFLAGIFQLFDGAGTVLFDSGEVALPAPDRDVALPIPGISGVRRVRFTATADESATPGFAELEVIGEFADPTLVDVEDRVVPGVASANPANGATNVPVDTVIEVSFTEVIDPTTVHAGTFSLRDDRYWGPVVAGSLSVSADRRTVRFTPEQPLFAGHSYVTRVEGVSDLAGNQAGFRTFSFTTAAGAGTDLNALPTSATVEVNPQSLFASGETTALVSISNVSRSGEVVPNGTRIGVTAQPTSLVSTNSAGGTLVGGVSSVVDGRFEVVTTLGGGATLTYVSTALEDLPPGQSRSAVIQVVSLDAEDRPVRLLGQVTLTLFRGTSAQVTVNPQLLLPDGVSFAEVSVVAKDNLGNPVPPGTLLAVTAEPVFALGSEGGTINGGVPSGFDPRFRVFETETGGVVEVSYTAPALSLAGNESRTAWVQVAAVNQAGEVTGLLGAGRITLRNDGFSGPQPELLSLSPSNGATGVGLNVVVVAEFSQSLDVSTVTSSTFRVRRISPDCCPAIAGTLAVGNGPRGVNTVVSFSPDVPLAPNARHDIDISTGITSATGIPLQTRVYSVFTTGVASDTEAPQVVQINPVDGSTAVPINSIVSVEFNEPMAPATLTTASFTLEAGGVLVSGRVTLGGGVLGPNTIATFIPDGLLPANATLGVTLTTAVTDVAGNPLPAEFVSTFSTAATDDNVQPSVLSVSPANGATGVSTAIAIVAAFDEPVNPATVSSSTFRVTFFSNFFGNVTVPGTPSVTGAGTTVTLVPLSPLFAGTNYRVELNTGIRDVAGNPLRSLFRSSFTTALGAGTGTLPTGASALVNPPGLFANGRVPTTVTFSNIVNPDGSLVPNGTRVAITAEPSFAPSAVGGAISGSTIGPSIDGRFLLFETLGAEVPIFYTPPDLTGLPSGATETGIIQLASVDADGRPVRLIGRATVTLFGIGSATVLANPTSLLADGVSTSNLTVTVRDKDGNPVPDGTPVGVTVAPVYSVSTAGGTIIDGVTSTADPRVQIFTTVGGQFTASYRSPATRGSGTAVIQVLTVDLLDRPTGLVTTANISLQ